MNIAASLELAALVAGARVRADDVTRQLSAARAAPQCRCIGLEQRFPTYKRYGARMGSIVNLGADAGIAPWIIDA